MNLLDKKLSNYRTHDKAAAVLQPLTLSKEANRGSQLYNKTKTKLSPHTPPRVQRPPSPKRIKLETDNVKDSAAADNKTPPKAYSIPCKSRTKLEYEAALGLILLSSQSQKSNAVHTGSGGAGTKKNSIAATTIRSANKLPSFPLF
jgi:hypothetical protein